MKELEHHYGANVHLLQNVALGYWLTQLGHPSSSPTSLPRWVRKMYQALLLEVMEREFPVLEQSFPTRMTAAHPEQKVTARVFNLEQKTVTVNLARAGTLPSQVCYETLGDLLNPQSVRQDHLLASRITLATDKVTGTELAGAKIGGSVRDAIVLLPDPMGATGHTLCETVSYYKNHVEGPAKKFIALHLILTPEYLRKVTQTHPDVKVYGLRLDRGLSPAAVLSDTPGKQWDQERGLNDNDYILPGAGGIGEALNNSWV